MSSRRSKENLLTEWDSTICPQKISDTTDPSRRRKSEPGLFLSNYPAYIATKVRGNSDDRNAKQKQHHPNDMISWEPPVHRPSGPCSVRQSLINLFLRATRMALRLHRQLSQSFCPYLNKFHAKCRHPGGGIQRFWSKRNLGRLWKLAQMWYVVNMINASSWKHRRWCIWQNQDINDRSWIAVLFHTSPRHG